MGSFISTTGAKKPHNANSSNPDPISYADINPEASNKNAYIIPFNYSAVSQTYRKKLAFNIKIVYETVQLEFFCVDHNSTCAAGSVGRGEKNEHSISSCLSWQIGLKIHIQTLKICSLQGYQ